MPSYKSKTGYACSCPDGNCDMSCRMYRLVSNKPSNADKIMAMTDEELAGWLERIRLCCSTDLCGRNCPFAEVCYSSAAATKETLDWLRQEVNK